MLFDKYRPSSPKEFCGEYQIKVAQQLMEKDFLPFNLLLTGPSGTGKTSLAKLYAQKLETVNVIEENCRNIGVNDLRTLLSNNYSRTLHGNGRTIIFLDELHSLSKEAQQALLNIEDTENRHLFLIAATDQPKKLTPALKSRFTDFNLPVPTMEEVKKHMLYILEQEDFSFKKATQEDKELLNYCYTSSNGNLRTLLTRLEQFLDGTLNVKITSDDELESNNLFSMVLKKSLISEVAKAAKEEGNLFGLCIGLTNYGYKMLENGNKKGLSLIRVFGKNLDSRYPQHVAFIMLYDEYISER